MRSIRRDLVLYFLALMAVVLGGVALLIDRVAGRTLEAREAASRQLIDLRCEDQIQQERDRFDTELTAQARLIAGEVQATYSTLFRAQFEKFILNMRLAPLGSLAAGMTPFPVYAPLWSQIGFQQRRFNDPVARLNEHLARQHFSKLDLAHLPSVDDHGSDFVHVSVPAFPRGEREYVSKTLHGEDWLTKIPPSENPAVVSEHYENRKLASGMSVRVVGHRSSMMARYLSPGGRVLFDPSPGPRIGGSRDSRDPLPRDPGRSDPPPPPGTLAQPDAPPPSIQYRFAYIQYGRPLGPLDERIQLIESRRDEEKATEAAKTRRDREGLRAWLALIASLSLIALVVGGLLLVRRGLKPLDTLTQAVAKVNERDFRLPVEPSQLSKELLPIHERLTQTLTQLQRAFEHDRQAVADISHELRTPVASLLATIDVSLRKPRSAEQYYQTLEDCRVITKQLGGLVERVMRLASLDAAPAKACTTLVNAVELAQGVATVIRPLAESHDLAFAVALPPMLPLQTNADTLREVLLNLLHNAIEYNRPGGAIALNVSHDHGRALFTVTDTGIGMAPEVKSRIFERFYRADASRTATGLHAGLGLAIVKECVDRLGGVIRVDSEPGRGSTFTVDLPAGA
jgi:signal transduction histidine kinase